MSEPATLYVSCNPAEGPVSRFGLPNVIIGGVRSLSNPKQIDYRPEEVVAIPGVEAERFQQEYLGALTSKALKKRTQKDHEAWLKLEEKLAKEEYLARQKAKAEAAAEAAAELEQAEPNETPADGVGAETQPTESEQ